MKLAFYFSLTENLLMKSDIHRGEKYSATILPQFLLWFREISAREKSVSHRITDCSVTNLGIFRLRLKLKRQIQPEQMRSEEVLNGREKFPGDKAKLRWQTLERICGGTAGEAPGGKAGLFLQAAMQSSEALLASLTWRQLDTRIPSWCLEPTASAQNSR